MKLLLINLFAMFIFTTLSQSILTRGEVFDYDIGDEFQYSYDNAPGIYVERYTVIDKQFSQNFESITYTLFKSIYNYGPDSDGNTTVYTSEDTVNQIINDLNDPITAFGDSTEIYVDADSSYYYHPDTIIEYDSNLCGLEVNGWNSYPPVFESNNIIRKWGRGVGLVWRYHYDPSSGSWHELENKKLYYYKKGNITCGTPVTASTGEYQKNSLEIIIFPIPTDKALNVQLKNNGKIDQIELINSLGTTVNLKVNKNGLNDYTIDTTDLPNGVYYIVVHSKNKVVNHKVVITH